MSDIDSSCFTLYGFTTQNCCAKDQRSQKISNSLLPISVGLYLNANNYNIPLCYSDFKLSTLDRCFHENSIFDTEKPHIDPNFVNPPPNDVYVKSGDSFTFYESKVVMFKGNGTELILRQDCFSFNCLQHIIMNNSSKKYKDTDSLLSDELIIETPYLWFLLWENRNDQILFDCIVFTDVSVIRMIKNAKTERAKEALKLIDRSLSDYESKGIMTYKENKKSTVAHQKVSLFPLRDIESLKNYQFNFNVKAIDTVIGEVQSDKNIWQDIEKNRLNDQIRNLTKEIERLKASHNSL